MLYKIGKWKTKEKKAAVYVYILFQKPYLLDSKA